MPGPSDKDDIDQGFKDAHPEVDWDNVVDLSSDDTLGHTLSGHEDYGQSYS